MKLLLTLMLYLSYINFISAYFFPLCTTKDDKSCMSYFRLPDFAFLKNEEKVLKTFDTTQDESLGFTTALRTLSDALSAIILYWKENINRSLTQTYELARQYCSSEGDFLFKHYPWFRFEEKAKADSKLYFLFIGTSLGTYLVLYVYFSKKLYSYYRSSLREQYLNNFRKILKPQD